MAIQMRKGLKSDFDPTKMLPGEWAVAVDTDTNNQIIWMCFSAGTVKRMMTVEDAAAQISEAVENATDDLKSAYLQALNEIKAACTASQTAAKTSEDNAKTSETNAAASASTATTKASNASTSATAAAQSATAAHTSETNAATSATSAASSASTATTKATAASSSATSAATSATAAASSATSASTSATNAANSDTAAHTSEVNAASSATSASSSASTATASISQSSASATSAAQSAVAASNSATAAAQSAIDAQNAVSSVTNTYFYAGSITVSQLPTSNRKVGQTYNLTDSSSYGPAGTNVAWNGTTWDALAGIVDMTPYLQISSITDYTASEIDNLWNSIDSVYTVKWNMVTSQMERTDLLYGVTTDTTNFKHSGSVNSLYSNPFDSIYPWSERQLCNIDIDKYMAFVAAGTGNIESCVTKWEHGTGIDFADSNGVWVYTPEFWHISYDSGSNRYFSVSPTQRNGWVHSPARIAGRWLGIDETRTINSASVHVLLPKVGNPAVNITFGNLHQYAKNYGATVNNVYAYDADQMLYLIEYANYNIQNSIGNGVSDLFQEGIHFSEAATSSATVKIPHSDKAIIGAQLDIGTTSGGYDIARAIITAVSTSNSIDTLTLNVAVTVTTSSYANIHGLSNIADTAIASMSGYIGTNGRSNAYYRGAVMYGNRWQYLLGLYRHTGDNHVYYANTEAIADTLDALNTTKCTDTGLTLPQGASGSAAEGYIKSLGIKTGILSSPPICTLTGGDSSNPVGDYFYTPSLATGNTVCMVGSNADYGARVGSSYAYWFVTASDSGWNDAARPLLKHS